MLDAANRARYVALSIATPRRVRPAPHREILTMDEQYHLISSVT